MYISIIVLEIGVPVANVTPWPAMLLAEVTGFHVHVEGPLEPPVWMPATRSILVGVSRFLK